MAASPRYVRRRHLSGAPTRHTSTPARNPSSRSTSPLTWMPSALSAVPVPPTCGGARSLRDELLGSDGPHADPSAGHAETKTGRGGGRVMRRITASLVALVALLTPVRSHALFHITQIDEVMSGAAGNPNLQYVQIRMLAGAQTFVANS